ncbi:hypothetical protein PLICRDRAFT_118433 [Plicaturopsis crispa FD-325 SS-3]|uniref:P-loop containing nucleoside triphosphate hydrolase protein n=1 Tax=Plicaturopsis crispa FD-325 SS-3 TaxID=944288 RepID=A0A0C9T7M1_PLICR|nr:hypothetical protein PLICRDRAFT_118433 [Plicaturopsis crispa FD-325 SS-3]
MSSTFATSLFGGISQQYVYESAKLFILGSLIETLRRLWYYFTNRLSLRYAITAQFISPDPAFEWMFLFLTQEKVWRTSQDFVVSAKSSQRRWGVGTAKTESENHVDYVPAYSRPHLFRWRGIFSRDMSVLHSLVDEARRRYASTTAPNVIIHTADTPTYGTFVWSNVKQKHHRPLNSLILEDGVLESILKDARDFFDMEEWYREAGIPHHRGYLLHGPPGTGKTSTIYAIASELGLEIYSLSLASGFVDDSFLQRAAASIPKHSILLIEDIDCAFPSREDDEDDEMLPTRKQTYPSPFTIPHGKKSNVTLSGLLNMIDGVGSEEGKLFFATTNYYDRLDPAMLRPGRIDLKIPYKLASTLQARALFDRFYPESRFQDALLNPVQEVQEILDRHQQSSEKTFATLADLSEYFADAIPPHIFSTAELQGYLLMWKMQPIGAALSVREWLEQETVEKADKAKRTEERKQRLKTAREQAKKDGERPVIVNIADGKVSAEIQPSEPPGLFYGPPTSQFLPLPPPPPVQMYDPPMMRPSYNVDLTNMFNRTM